VGRRNAPRSAEGIERCSSDFPEFQTGEKWSRKSKPSDKVVLCSHFMPVFYAVVVWIGEYGRICKKKNENIIRKQIMEINV
jgi:hypothetical protein